MTPPVLPAPLTADALRAAFDAPAPLTIGLEEECFVCDPVTLDLVPRARDLVAAGAPVKLELPAAQLEIATPPCADVLTAIAALAEGRRGLLAAAAGAARFLAAGVHPFADPLGALNGGPRYDPIREEYGSIARRQLVGALQVHVAVGSAERTLAAYNALRAHLPALAALAANAPFHAGRDTGLASVRPTIAETLPRQGVPPAIPSWEAFVDALRWGEAVGALPKGRGWWWELRPHPAFGTLELRVPDAQASIDDAAAVAAVAHCLVARLADAEPAPPAPTWRIDENRWSALRHGVEGSLADLETGERRPTRACLHELLDELTPVAERLSCAEALDGARRLVERNGEQGLEFLVHRSAYQLKEADPHSWAIPRLAGAAKAALVEIQADEYGGGRPERMHAQLFADAMAAVGLDASYGAYLDHIPGVTLATVNLMSLLGLHRRRRAALVGHLALFEMSSSLPNARYARGLRRLGWTDERATAFFDETLGRSDLRACAVSGPVVGVGGGAAGPLPSRFRPPC